MKILIVYQSVHHGNTKKVAEAMAKVLKAKLAKPSEVKNVAQYDVIGFGSGIYFWRHHISLLRFVDKLPQLQNKKAFIFSTAGLKAYGFTLMHHALKKRLLAKGFKILGEYTCLGYDSYGMLKYISGLNKGRPNQKDIKKAKYFARELKKKV